MKHYENVLYCKNFFSWKCENKTFLRLKLCLKLLLQTQTLLDASAKIYSDTGSELPPNFSKVLESPSITVIYYLSMMFGLYRVWC